MIRSGYRQLRLVPVDATGNEAEGEGEGEGEDSTATHEAASPAVVPVVAPSPDVVAGPAVAVDAVLSKPVGASEPLVRQPGGSGARGGLMG